MVFIFHMFLVTYSPLISLCVEITLVTENVAEDNIGSAEH